MGFRARDDRRDAGERVRKGTQEPLVSVKLEAEQVGKKGNDFILAADPSIVVDSRTYKMSKSRGNVINPDHIVREYGADSLRLYEMFMGPLEATKPWSMSGVEGLRASWARVWRMIVDDRSENGRLASRDRRRRTHSRPIADPAPDDPGRFPRHRQPVVQHGHQPFDGVRQRVFGSGTPPPRGDRSVRVAARPVRAAHCGGTVGGVGHTESLAYAKWPEFDPSLLVESTVEIPVQFSGKVRGKIVAPKGADQTAVEALVRADTKLAEQFAGKTVVKTVFVADRLVNFVVK